MSSFSSVDLCPRQLLKQLCNIIVNTHPLNVLIYILFFSEPKKQNIDIIEAVTKRMHNNF